jgi:hypothetical protein
MGLGAVQSYKDRLNLIPNKKKLPRQLRVSGDTDRRVESERSAGPVT